MLSGNFEFYSIQSFLPVHSLLIIIVVVVVIIIIILITNCQLSEKILISAV